MSEATIQEVWQDQLGDKRQIRGGKEIPADSECGVSCTGAIDACGLLLEHLEAAVGDDTNHRESILNATQLIVEVYING